MLLLCKRLGRDSEPVLGYHIHLKHVKQKILEILQQSLQTHRPPQGGHSRLLPPVQTGGGHLRPAAAVAALRQAALPLLIVAWNILPGHNPLIYATP